MCLRVVRLQVQLSLGDFVAARRSLKKALLLGSQQTVDRQSVKKAFKYGKLVLFVSSQIFLLGLLNICINFTLDCGFFSGSWL